MPKADVRARVLRAALAAFEELGPDKVRVQDIAERAGMSSGHVMYYFGDRDRILLSTLLLSEESLAERRDRAVVRAADPQDAVAKVTRLYLPTGPTDVRWSLWAQAVARPPSDHQTRTALRDAADGWSSCIAGIVRGMGRGERGPRADADSTAYRYCRLMDGLALEILLSTPGRGRAWALSEAAAALQALSR